MCGEEKVRDWELVINLEEVLRIQLILRRFQNEIDRRDIKDCINSRNLQIRRTVLMLKVLVIEVVKVVMKFKLEMNYFRKKRIAIGRGYDIFFFDEVIDCSL